MMAKQVQLILNSSDVFQLLDGLKARAEQWDNTASFLRTGILNDNICCISDCESAAEAMNICLHYREVVASIERQIAGQDI